MCSNFFLGKRAFLEVILLEDTDLMILITSIPRSDTTRGYRSYDFDNFNPKYFTPGWDTVFDHLGDGCSVQFPIQMKCTTRWSKKLFHKDVEGTLKLKKRYFVEKVYLRLFKFCV